VCELGNAIRSGKLPGVLYCDETAQAQQMRGLLDSANAKYEIADAAVEALPGPVFVVNGSFLDFEGLKDVLRVS